MINKYSILNGAKCFSSDGLQNYLVFISTRRIEWIINNGRYSRIESWESTEMSQESIKNPHTSVVNFAPKLIDGNQFREAKFRGICVKQDSVSFFIKCSKFIYLHLFIYYMFIGFYSYSEFSW